MALAIERESIFDWWIDQARHTNHPGTSLANSGRFLQFAGIARLLRRNRRRVAFMKVEGILGDAPQCVVAKFALAKEAGQIFGVAATVRKMRESKGPPGADIPIAIAAIDSLDRRSVRISKVGVKSVARGIASMAAGSPPFPARRQRGVIVPVVGHCRCARPAAIGVCPRQPAGAWPGPRIDPLLL